MSEAILQKLRDKKIPLVAFIELTNRCNLDCIHCMRPKSLSGELSKARLELLIAELADLGCLNISFTGGEPLLHKDFFELAAYARRKKFGIKISSNGLCVNKRSAGKLARLNLSLAQISIYGRTAGVHDSITKVPGSHRKTLDAIGLLAEYGIPVQAHMMVTRQNFQELETAKEMCLNKGWKFSFDFIIYPGYNGHSKSRDCRITDKQLDEARSRGLIHADLFMDEGREKDRFYNIDDIATVSCRVSSAGDVFPSGTVRLVMGNIRKKSFSDIWFGSEAARELRSLKRSDFECSACKMSSKCSWDVGLAYAEHGRVTSTPREWCRFIGKEN